MKEEYIKVFFDLHYEYIYFKHFESGIRKYNKNLSRILMSFSIVSAVSVWIRYYLPILNFLTVVTPALTVVMIIIISYLPYSKQLIHLELFRKEAGDLIHDFKMKKRTIEDVDDKDIQIMIEEFESKFRRLDILYIEPLNLPTEERLPERCQNKAAEENNIHFEKEYGFKRKYEKVINDEED